MIHGPHSLSSSFRDAHEMRGPGIQNNIPYLPLDSGFAGFRPRPGMTGGAHRRIPAGAA